jgi:hypothetical protein
MKKRVNYLLVGRLKPRVVTGEKNSPTAAHAGRKRRLKWVPGAEGYSWATLPRGL